MPYGIIFQNGMHEKLSGDMPRKGTPARVWDANFFRNPAPYSGAWKDALCVGKPDVPNGVANREPAIFDAYIGAKQRRKDTGRLLWKWRRYRRRKSPTAVSGANMRQNCRLCKLRHRGYKSCTFYAPTTRINAGCCRLHILCMFHSPFPSHVARSKKPIPWAIAQLLHQVQQIPQREGKRA